jgi:small subunit ribosomal protein S20
LAHSRSALKRWRQSLKRRAINRSVKSRTRTLLGKAITAISNDVGSAEEAVRDAISGLDRAAQKGVIHPNAAARGKSRLLKRYNLAMASSVAAAARSAPPSEAEAPKTTRKAPARKAEKPAADKKASSRASKEKPAPRSRAKKNT